MKKILTYQDMVKVFEDELKRSKELVSWINQRLQVLRKIDFEKDMLNEANLTIGCLFYSCRTPQSYCRACR